MAKEEFKDTMLSLNDELERLNQEAKQLEEQIFLNIKGMLGE